MKLNQTWEAASNPPDSNRLVVVQTWEDVFLCRYAKGEWHFPAKLRSENKPVPICWTESAINYDA